MCVCFSVKVLAQHLVRPGGLCLAGQAGYLSPCFCLLWDVCFLVCLCPCFSVSGGVYVFIRYVSPYFYGSGAVYVCCRLCVCH